MSSLVPESISSNATVAYDLAFKNRLVGLNLTQLKVWVTTETNPVKLQLLLQMFGIDGNIFNFLSLTDVQRMALLQQLISVMRYSGTEWSIINMATALGASSAYITYGEVLLHDGTALYDGAYTHGSGAYNRFAITVHVLGVPAYKQSVYEANFRALMKAWQPVRVFLADLIFE